MEDFKEEFGFYLAFGLLITILIVSLCLVAKFIGWYILLILISPFILAVIGKLVFEVMNRLL